MAHSYGGTASQTSGQRQRPSSSLGGLGREGQPSWARSKLADARSRALLCLYVSSFLSLYLRTLHAKGKNCLRVWKNSKGQEENSGRKSHAGHGVALRKLGGGGVSVPHLREGRRRR